MLRRTHSMSAESCKPQPSSSRVYTTRSRVGAAPLHADLVADFNAARIHGSQFARLLASFSLYQRVRLSD